MSSGAFDDEATAETADRAEEEVEAAARWSGVWRGSTGLVEDVKGPGVKAGMSVRREGREVEESRGGGGIAGDVESVMMERRWA